MKLPPVVARIANQTKEHPAPICVLVVGMAGSGKTTLMAQLQQSTMPNEEEEEEKYQQQQQQDDDNSKPTLPADMPAYCVNLDPATLDVPYGASIDIRDTVDYKVRLDYGYDPMIHPFSHLFSLPAKTTRLANSYLFLFHDTAASHGSTQSGSQWCHYDVLEFVCDQI
jgi:GTPase SAR1 family protein